MQIFSFFDNLAILFSKIVIFMIELVLNASPILLSLLWLQTEFDSTQSYYHYKFCRKTNIYNILFAPLITMKYMKTSLYPNETFEETPRKKTNIYF